MRPWMVSGVKFVMTLKLQHYYIYFLLQSWKKLLHFFLAKYCCSQSIFSCDSVDEIIKCGRFLSKSNYCLPVYSWSFFWYSRSFRQTVVWILWMPSLIGSNNVMQHCHVKTHSFSLFTTRFSVEHVAILARKTRKTCLTCITCILSLSPLIATEYDGYNL